MMDEVPIYEAPQPIRPPRRRWGLIIVIGLVAIAVLAVFLFVRPAGPTSQENFEIIEDPTLPYNPEGDREALQRNIEGTDRQFLYSQRGTFVRVEGDLLYFSVENITVTDDGTYVNVVERSGLVSADIAVTKFTPDPNDRSSVLSSPSMIRALRRSDIIEVRTYQNILAAEEFTIEEIDILY